MSRLNILTAVSMEFDAAGLFELAEFNFAMTRAPRWPRHTSIGIALKQGDAWYYYCQTFTDEDTMENVVRKAKILVREVMVILR